VARGDRGSTRGRDGTAEGWQALRLGHRRRTEIPGEARRRGHPGVRTISILSKKAQNNEFPRKKKEKKRTRDQEVDWGRGWKRKGHTWGAPVT